MIARQPRGRLLRVAVLVVVGVAIAAASLLGWEPTRVAARGVIDTVGLRRVERYADEIQAAATESGLDPDLLAAICWVESRGRPAAVSSADALGLFQLQEGAAGDAARRLGLPRPSRDELLTDTALNARLAAVHVAWLIEHEGPDLERVLAAYNAGRTKVRRWIRADGSFDAWRTRQEREGDSQVLAYARRVLDVRDRFAERGTFSAR